MHDAEHLEDIDNLRINSLCSSVKRKKQIIKPGFNMPTTMPKLSPPVTYMKQRKFLN